MNTPEYEAMYERIYDYGIEHDVLPSYVLQQEPEKEIEIFGKPYKEFTQIEEMARREAYFRLEYVFELSCVEY